MKWNKEDWNRLHSEGSDVVNNPPSQSSPDVQKPVSNDILEDIFDFDFFEEQERQECIEEDQTAVICGHYVVQQNHLATVLHDHAYATKKLQGQTHFTQIMDALPEAEYRRKEKVTEKPYVKKPLNAFMHFLKKNRASAEAELGTRTSAVVNKHLGQRWKLLSPEQREVYVEEARVDSLLHLFANPDWSNKINYRHKKKRVSPKVREEKKK
ncbi:lymphoid enhancer-binding factor 1-like [Gouania willdenowi]|uniref:lymphoid enhancer-binding factor 1-like n=1 Tax=Gouania willdenowi TaxID=441366 RepID=UPI001054329E|nr:lymphoid enhancer-binding factor 1-like [Gouania willdenowi]